MKKIDAHAHIGDFGSWAGVDGSPEQLIAFMDEYEIEQTVLCAKDHTGNEGVAEAAARYPGRFIPLVYLNPLEGADICREKVETYVDGKGFRGIKMNPLRHAFIGLSAIEALSSMRINKAFMGATGVSLTAGMTNTTFLEAEIKRAVVHRADSIYGMADSSKIGREAIVTFCHLKDLTAFITDREPPKEYVDLCRQENVKLRYE